MSGGTFVHALYANDFLHFTDNPKLYQAFKGQFQKRFDIKTGSVSVYLGNRVTVDRTRQNVVLPDRVCERTVGEIRHER